MGTKEEMEMRRRLEVLEGKINGTPGVDGIESNQRLIMNHMYNPNDGILREIKKMREWQLKIIGGFLAIQGVFTIAFMFLKK